MRESHEEGLNEEMLHHPTTTINELEDVVVKATRKVLSQLVVTMTPTTDQGQYQWQVQMLR